MRRCEKSRYTKEHIYHTIISAVGNPLVEAWDTAMHTDNAGTADTKNICSTSCAFAIGGFLGCAGVILIGKATLHIIPRVGRGLAVVVAGGREIST